MTDTVSIIPQISYPLDSILGYILCCMFRSLGLLLCLLLGLLTYLTCQILYELFLYLRELLLYLFLLNLQFIQFANFGPRLRGFGVLYCPLLIRIL